MTAERTPAHTKHPPDEDEVDDLSIVYPDSDGEPMAENEEQLYAMIDAITTLREWYASREDVHVGGDLLIYYRMNDNETRVAPDVFVVFGSDKARRLSWIVWREGKAPDIVMELASGSTWRRDMREKRDIYAEMGVTEYWRFDPSSSYFSPPLVGETLVDGGYNALELASGSEGVLRGHSTVLGLDICAMPDGSMRFYDPASEQWLRTHAEEMAARQEAEEAAAREMAARQAAEEELRALREELQRYRSEQPDQSG